jgi:hypothetical protein
MVDDPSRLPAVLCMSRPFPAFGVFVLAALAAGSAQAQVCNPIEEPGTGATLHVAPAHQAPPRQAPPYDDELPWCVSADDPRCAPLHNDSGPLSTERRVTAGVFATPSSPVISAESVRTFTTRVGLFPHPGVRHRVERPPRASDGRSP